MPSKTPRQHHAMAAAAAGKSTLGIPRSVGREFLKEDSKMPKNSGYSMKPKRVGSAAEDAAKQRQKLKNALNVARKSPAGKAAAKRKAKK